MKRLVFVALAALAACGTPQEQCISRNTRDLRTVDRLIAETEGNLQRGYALETVTRFEDYWGTCLERVVVGNQIIAQPQFCMRERAYTEERPKAIDLKAEAQKLEGLKAKRTELASAAAPLIAQCKVEFPE
jgi:phosphoribosylformimino-5-aminoimidazole carboxamide ribonucleotide (ProFAR) isomerase